MKTLLTVCILTLLAGQAQASEETLSDQHSVTAGVSVVDGQALAPGGVEWGLSLVVDSSVGAGEAVASVSYTPERLANSVFTLQAPIWQFADEDNGLRHGFAVGWQQLWWQQDSQALSLATDMFLLHHDDHVAAQLTCIVARNLPLGVGYLHGFVGMGADAAATEGLFDGWLLGWKLPIHEGVDAVMAWVDLQNSEERAELGLQWNFLGLDIGPGVAWSRPQAGEDVWFLVMNLAGALR